jgi:hypothetical protein
VFHAHLIRGALGDYARETEEEEISNGGGGGNSKIPHYAPYIPSGRRIVG